MLRRLFRLLLFGVVIIVLIILFAPSLIKGAGNALISSVNNSAAQGLAQLIPHAQDNGADLQLKLDNLAPNADYYVTLDEGQCGGFILFRVGKVVTDGNGSATTLLSLSGASNALSQLRSALQQSLWVDVHQGNDASGQTIACGQVLSDTTTVVETPGAPTPTTDTGANNSPFLDTPTPGVPSGVSNSSANGDGSSSGGSTSPGTQPSGGFPGTGVAPAQRGAYDNYTYPRKY